MGNSRVFCCRGFCFCALRQIEKILGRRPIKEPDPDDEDAVREGGVRLPLSREYVVLMHTFNVLASVNVFYNMYYYCWNVTWRVIPAITSAFGGELREGV